MALIAEGVSFGRANIYNYFQNKDEVFLALLTREHELWAADLTNVREDVLRDLVNWDSEAIAQALAGSLNARIPMLKLLAASLPDMEQNSRHERLIELKRAYKAVLASPRALLHAAKPLWDEARIDRFAFSFMPFLHGVYPYAFHSKKAARDLAEAIGADLFEIEPEQPYTRADLNWNNKSSRSSVEMNDETSRPAIASTVANIASYDVVYVGFPVWWYVEPRIIDTFLGSYDLSGKTIVPFATSGGSGLGKAPQRMQALAPNADVRQGGLLNGRHTARNLAEWAEMALR